MTDNNAKTGWHLLSNQGRVLLYVAANPDARLRDVALATGLTERAAFALVDDLVRAGIVVKARVGRRSRYAINQTADAASAVGVPRTVAEFVGALTSPKLPQQR